MDLIPFSVDLPQILTYRVLIPFEQELLAPLFFLNDQAFAGSFDEDDGPA